MPKINKRGGESAVGPSADLAPVNHRVTRPQRRQTVDEGCGLAAVTVYRPNHGALMFL